MAIPNTAVFGDPRREQALNTPLVDTAKNDLSAVSWAAIFAGAAGTAALSLLLLMLGMGLGLSSTSPWALDHMGQTAMGATVIAWVVFSQVVASGLGGYLAGRLRTRWVDVQRDEVHFRDTAHGFLAWAVAALVTATMLTQVTGAVAPLDGSIRTAAGESRAVLPDMDQRFMLTPQRKAGAMNGVDQPGQPVTQQVEGVPRQADLIAGRWASTHSALWVFVALLSGAFVASLAATLGGRQRDA